MVMTQPMVIADNGHVNFSFLLNHLELSIFFFFLMFMFTSQSAPENSEVIFHVCAII